MGTGAFTFFRQAFNSRCRASRCPAFSPARLVFLGRILREVVQLEGAVLEVLDELPVSLPHNAAGGGAEMLEGRPEVLAVALEIGGEVPEERARGEGAAGEEGSEIDPVESFREVGPGGAGEGREKVDLVNGHLAERARFDPSRPADEERFADATLVEHPLRAAQGQGVGHATVGAVVGREENEGVVGGAELVEEIEDLADGKVHGLDHGGIPVVSVMSAGRFSGVLRGEIPAGLDRGVDRVEGKVDEDGTRLLGGLLGPDPGAKVGGEASGEVFAHRPVGELRIAVGGEVGLRVAPLEAAEVGMESVLERVARDMPLAGHRGTVAGAPEDLRDGGEILPEDGGVPDGDQLAVRGLAAIGIAHGEDAVARGVESGEEGGAGRSAVRGGSVGLREDHPLLCDAIDVGRLVVVGSLDGEVGVSEVVGVEENDVRPVLLAPREAWDEEGGDERESGNAGRWHESMLDCAARRTTGNPGFPPWSLKS